MGPGICILMSSKLSDDMWTAIREHCASQGEMFDEWGCSIDDCPIYFADGDYQLREYSDASLGGHQVCGIVDAYAGCNDPLSHRRLGEFALWIAQKFDGLVDLDILNHQSHAAKSIDIGKKWDLPGYEAAAGHFVPSGGLVADPSWLQAWLKHPDFYLIK